MFSGKRLWLFYLLLPFYCWLTSGSAQTPRSPQRRKVSKHPRVSMTKDTDLLSGAWLQFSRNRRSARARWADKADALVLDQKLFYHHSIFLIGEDVLFAQTWNRAAGKHNAAESRPTWFSVDPRQINASRTMRQERGRFPPWPCLSQCHPLLKVTQKLSQYAPGKGETTHKSKRRQKKTNRKGAILIASFEFQVLIFITENFHFSRAHRVRLTTPNDVSYLQSGRVDFHLTGSELWLTADGKVAAHYDFLSVKAVFFPALCGEELWFLFAESTPEQRFLSSFLFCTPVRCTPS